MCRLMSYFNSLQGCVGSCLTYYDLLQGCVGSCLTLTGCRDVSTHVSCLVAGMCQLMSQGTADMLLDACSDYWDGHDLCSLTEVDRYVHAHFLFIFLKLFLLRLHKIKTRA